MSSCTPDKGVSRRRMSSPAAFWMIVSEMPANAFRIRSAVGLSVILCLFSGWKPGRRACSVSRDRRRTNSVTVNTRKVFHMCWSLSDGSSKFIPIDEQPNHQIVHTFRLGKAQRATNQPLDPGPEIDVFALDFLRVLLAYVMLLDIDMPLIGPPSVGVILCDAKGL